MLSDKLLHMADKLTPHQATGLRLDPLGCTILVQMLRDAADQARALEGSPVPPSARGELPPGVIPFRRRGAA